jgi:electron transfer flavoprotein alpha subunit
MKEFSGVWILGEQRNQEVQTITYELLTRGLDLAKQRQVPLSVILLGKTKKEDLEKVIRCGADKIVNVTTKGLETFLPEPYTGTLEYLVNKYKPEIIIAGATSTGRTLMPLLAVKCHSGLTADCTQLEIEKDTGNLLQVRPAIGGNIMATIITPNHRPQLATVRPHSTPPAQEQVERKGEVIEETVDKSILQSRVKILNFEKAKEDSANIQEADVVVAGGRGLKKADNFAMISKIAKLLNGAVGASRDAVDRGWVTYPHQVGLSGKTISPKLYICSGISGSIQHLAGIKTAENIIAINLNPEAEIFKIANYGIVADHFEVLPRLIRKLEELTK